MDIEGREQLIATADGTLASEWFDAEHEHTRLLLFPAMGVKLRHYRAFASGLASTGITCVTVEYRGQDKNSRIDRSSRFGYAEIATIDIPAALAAVTTDTVPTWVGGHSLGAQLTTLAAGTDGLHDAAGILTVAGGTPYFRSYPPRDAWRPLLGTTGPALVATAVGYWPGDKLGIGGRQSKHLTQDWAKLAWSGDFTKLRGIDPAKTDFTTFDRPFAAVVFDDDPLAPLSAAEALATTLPHAKRSFVCSPGSGGHVQWLKKPENAISSIQTALADT
ncbi:alpha/beta fold hydrolase [Rhodococcus erythropolis]|uniref:alpha/beta fold hydrolase n=1 Tax=Rhodococcus erythropolis TaxID=1833 RepID=UPI001BECA172|nr:alpha/beta fold hydrolase [Rhodococcus erythropolis]MBT2263386.1 alpha/beta fold hydrolase [Rhodococcus erythropolis]